MYCASNDHSLPRAPHPPRALSFSRSFSTVYLHFSLGELVVANSGRSPAQLPGRIIASSTQDNSFFAEADEILRNLNTSDILLPVIITILAETFGSCYIGYLTVFPFLSLILLPKQ